MAKKTEKSPINPKKTVKKKRKSHVTRPTKTELLMIEERRKLVVQLTKTGVSIRQISEQLKARGYEKVSPATISNDLTVALKDLSSNRLSDTELLVEVEMQKIDDWELQLNLLLQELTQGKIFTKDKIEDITKVINTLKTVQNQRDRFQSLSKREKSKIDARAALAKLMGVDPERLPNPNEK